MKSKQLLFFALAINISCTGDRSNDILPNPELETSTTNDTVVLSKSIEENAQSEVTDSTVYDLMYRALTWADTNSVLDIIPVIKKDSIYYSVDLTKQKINCKILAGTNLFSKEFISNYDTIINKIDSLLKSGEKENVWLVGDLPPYNFANDVSPWCDCQDDLGWSKIIIEHVNGSEYIWKWDVASELGPGWNEHRYSFSVIIEDGTLKISSMEGFNSDFQ